MATIDPAGIDKDALYGRYQSREDAQHDLHMRAVHKALDIPERDDVQISNNTKTGIGALGALGIAAGAGIPSAIIAAIAMLSGQKPPATVPPPMPAVQQPVGPVDSAYDVIFYDKDGNKITVPNINQKK